jgi:hypothetical protein
MKWHGPSSAILMMGHAPAGASCDRLVVIGWFGPGHDDEAIARQSRRRMMRVGNNI